MKSFLRSVAAKVPCDPDRLRVVCTIHGSVVELLDGRGDVLAGSPIEHGEEGAARRFAEVLGRSVTMRDAFEEGEAITADGRCQECGTMVGRMQVAT